MTLISAYKSTPRVIKVIYNEKNYTRVVRGEKHAILCFRLILNGGQGLNEFWSVRKVFL